MKTKLKMALIAAMSALALAVKAQDAGGPPDGDGPGGGQGPGRHHPPVPAIVRALDANHDGIIDSNEIANASAVLKTLDKNGDGKLTRDEYMGPRPGGPRGGRPGGDDANAQNNDGPQGGPPEGDQGGGPGGGGHRHPPMPAIIGVLDANHDGVIDADEIANASAALKTLDKNGDGQLTRDEYLGKRPGRPPQDAGDGNGAGGPPDGPPPGN